MRVRCPHCSNTVAVLDTAPLGEIDCPSCGSSFSLVVDETMSHRGSIPKQVAQFQLLEPLGTGAFGTVWKAQDTELQRVVAIKIPRKGQLTPDETEKFIREARAVAQLKHPRIVSVHEVGRHDDTVYIVSDLVDGISLSDWLTGKRPTHREAAELCRKLAEALDHAHQCGIIHRDLKPANIMIDAAGEPHIMDFGLAKREAAEVTMTVDGQVLGTPAYMSPEQARGEGHYADRRSDIYSVGVILYELLTGERPFRGNSRMLLHQVLHDEPPAPRKLDGRIPRDLETICLKCLDKNPERRYQQAADLSADLGRWLHHEPISARPVGPIGRAWRWSRRNPALAIMSAVAAIALIATAGISVAFGVHQWQTATNLAKQQKATQKALRQTKQAKDEVETQRNEARTQANIAKEKETIAKEAQGKAEAAERLAHDRLASIRRYLYAADMNLVQQAITDPTSDGLYRAIYLLHRHANQQVDDEDLRGFEWKHLNLLCNGAKFSRFLERGAVSKLAYSPDGRLLAVALGGLGQFDGIKNTYQKFPDEIYVLESTTGNEIAKLSVHPGTVTHLMFTSDSQRLIEGRQAGRSLLGKMLGDPQILIAPSGSGSASQNQAEPDNPSDQTSTEQSSLDEIQTGQLNLGDAAGAMLKLRYQFHAWNVGTWDCVSQEPIEAAQLDASPDAKQIVTLQLGVAQQNVFLHADGTARQLWSQNLTQSALMAPNVIVPIEVRLSPTGKQIALMGVVNSFANSVGRIIGGSEGLYREGAEIHLIDVASGSVISHIPRNGVPKFLCYAREDKLLAIGDKNEEISLWNPETGSLIRSLGICPKLLQGCFSFDGRFLAVGCSNGYTRVYSVKEQVPPREFRAATHQNIQALAFSPNGNHLATGGYLGLYAWDVRRDVGITKWKLKNGAIGGIVFDPAGQTLLAVRKRWETGGLLVLESNAIQIEKFNLQTSRSEKAISYKKKDLSYTSSPLYYDGKRLLMPLPHHVDVVDAATADLQFSAPNVTGPAAMSPDHTTMTTISENQAIVWTLASGEKLYTLEGHQNPLSCLAYSKNSKQLLTGDQKGDVWQWDLTSGKGKLVLIGQAGCRAIVYTPDEQDVLYASGTELFRWKQRENEVERLTSAPVFVNELQLSPDGFTLVMMTAQSVWLLDPYQGQIRLHLQHPSLTPASVAFSNDSRTLAIAWRDQILGSGGSPPEVWFYHSSEPLSVGGRQEEAATTSTGGSDSAAASDSAPP